MEYSSASSSDDDANYQDRVLCKKCISEGKMIEVRARKPVRLDHLAVVACLKALHPFDESKLDGVWFSVFSHLIKNTIIGLLMLRFGRGRSTTCGEIVEILTDRQAPMTSRRSIFLRNLDKAAPICCCDFFRHCRDARFYCCYDFFSDFTIYSFNRLREHYISDFFCCCNGFLNANCMNLEFRRRVYITSLAYMRVIDEEILNE